MITCPKCGRQLHEANGYGISQIVLVDDEGRGVRNCLDCVVAPDPCEECEFNKKLGQKPITTMPHEAQKGCR